MFKSVLAAVLAIALAAPVLAQTVKVTRTDGRVLQGELLGFENGRYKVRISGGTVEEIEESKVRDIVLISPTGERGQLRDSGALEAARDAFERHDFDLALQKIAEALRSLDDDRARATELTARISKAYLEKLLEQRDAARFGEALRQILPTLSADARRDLFQKMAERLSDLHRSAPDNAFTAALSDALARQADAGAFSEESRVAVADLLLERAGVETARKEFAAALTLTQGAVRIDPKRRDALKGRIAEMATARARSLLEKGDAARAVQAARDAAAADPDNAETRKLVEEVEFAALKQQVDLDTGGPDVVEALRKFLAREPSAEQKDWAEKALARLTSSTRSQATQLGKYFPLKTGRFLVYRRGDGEFQERIHTDSVEREGDLIRAHNTVQENYREYATTKAYVVEIEKDTVILPTPSGREPLLKFPATVGDSWTWQSKSREFRRDVKAIGESIVVGREGESRTYTDCLVVDFTSTLDRDGAPVALTSRSYYAPGIGLVKLEFLNAEFRKFNLELVDLGQD